MVGFYEFISEGYVLWHCDWGFYRLEGVFFNYELSASYCYGEAYEENDEVPSTPFVKIYDKEFV